MSRNTKQSVRCPQCGEMSDVTVWESINADMNGDLKQDLLQRRINMFCCPSCSYTALMPSGLLYHDIKKKLLISFSPCSDALQKMDSYNELKKNTAEIKAEFKGYNLRFVTDYNELLEKILIFDNDLADKTIEMIKLMILSQEIDKSVNRICRFGKLEDGSLEFVIYDTAENQTYTSTVPFETYEAVDRSLRESGVKPYSFDWEIVDASYATKLLQGYNN